jgi:hypothetical protein
VSFVGAMRLCCRSKIPGMMTGGLLLYRREPLLLCLFRHPSFALDSTLYLDIIGLSAACFLLENSSDCRLS